MMIGIMRMLLAPLSRFPSIHWRNLLTCGGLKMDISVDQYHIMKLEWQSLVVRNKEQLGVIAEKEDRIIELLGTVAKLELDLQRKKTQLKATWTRPPVPSQTLDNVRRRRNSVDTIYSTATVSTNVYDLPAPTDSDVTDIFPPRTQMFDKTGYARCKVFKYRYIYLETDV